MVEHSYLTNQFLIAMPGLADPNFFHTVTYVCEHNDGGAMGIVINRPLSLNLADLLENMELEGPQGEGIGEMPVYSGGPVHPEQGFVLHSPGSPWDSTLAISEGVAITTSQDILRAIASGDGPRRALVALGYAGWGPGQLEHELAANAWLSCPASIDILFDTPHEQRWSAAAALLGVDLGLLSGDAGHA